MEWYKLMIKSWVLALKKYATFKGRTSREEFWYFVLFNTILLFLVQDFSVLLWAVLDMLGMPYSELVLIFFGFLCVVYWLGIIIPSLAITVRRLHDVGKSAWWLFGFILFNILIITGVAFFIYKIVEIAQQERYASFLFVDELMHWRKLLNILAIIETVIPLVILYFLAEKSQDEENIYGPKQLGLAQIKFN